MEKYIKLIKCTYVTVKVYSLYNFVRSDVKFRMSIKDLLIDTETTNILFN